MTARTARAAIAITAIAMHTAHAQTQTSAGSVVFPRYSAVPVGASETEILRRMSDANILGHLATIDSIEVVISEWAAGHSKSDDVIKYAKAMDSRYRGVLNRDHQLGQETRVGVATMEGDLKRSHLGTAIDSVQLASDLNIDRNYLASQIQLHDHMLGELGILRATARNTTIREHLDAQVPIVQDELARARALARARGFVSK